MNAAHDYDDPGESFINGLDAVMAAALAEPCPMCGAHPRPLPMLGTRYGLDLVHEPDCPADDDG